MTVTKGQKWKGDDAGEDEKITMKWGISCINHAHRKKLHTLYWNPTLEKPMLFFQEEKTQMKIADFRPHLPQQIGFEEISRQIFS